MTEDELAALPYPEYLEAMHSIAIELARRHSHPLTGITLDAFSCPGTTAACRAAAVWDRYLRTVDPSATELFFTDLTHELAGHTLRLALVWVTTALDEPVLCGGPRMVKILG